ncbi:AFG1-like ATPase [Hondaea fermentalgiana]|uniref:AFG1-like ATPase n=1 Tax=Hondaea fermentalgiana TaxID=2315210 RepID=A0A2R5GJN6_9STRA|nr:AFG1-like ATPase [Hondaea fermentalgiana]|eukprot:GBG31106.1 AFG1-like ATPase [Hondaea fermentalgiana]
MLARGALGARGGLAAAVAAGRAQTAWTRALSGGAVTALYESRVEKGIINDDPSQRVACAHLDRVYEDVLAFEEGRHERLDMWKRERRAAIEADAKAAEEEQAKSSGWFAKLFGKTRHEGGAAGAAKAEAAKREEQAARSKLNAVKAIEAPQSLYMYGGPGSGKTYTMHLLYDVLEIPGKRRVHFHEFMLQVHRMLHSLQQRGFKSDEMIERCVDALYEEGWVLCFDEFQVTDIADAMIIRRLFDSLLARGVVVVATSNRAPSELYKNGIQRDLFVPFIEDVEKNWEVVNVQSETDYRMVTLEALDKKKKKKKQQQREQEKDGGEAGKSKKDDEEDDTKVYFTTSGGVGGAAQFERLFDSYTKGNVLQNSSLSVQGRKIKIPEAARNEDVARFSFDDLCGKPMGAADYYAIASTFHTIFVDQVPVMRLNMINQIRRFITMIDTFYDQNVVVVIGAEAPMGKLLDRGDVMGEDDSSKIADQIQEVDIIGDAAYVPARSNIDEIFAFDRTLSRLHEMQRADYLQRGRERAKQGSSPVRFLSQFEHESLSKGDIGALWDRYDLNGDGVIDNKELKAILTDITLFRSGHRHVPEEVYSATRQALAPQGDEVISKDDFYAYFSKYGLSTRG